MKNVKNTLTELNQIIEDLKTHAINATALSGQDLTNLETRIKHLRDKTQPELTGTTKLDTDLKDIDGLDNVINIGLNNANNQIRKLTDEKTVLEAEKIAKQAE